MTNEILDLEDKLHALQLQLDFLLRAFAAMSADETDPGLQPTVDEAFRGMELGQSIIQKMLDLTSEVLEKYKLKPG